eukprot:PhF_6_TR40386/c0_g1_i1/m.60159
MNPYPPIPPSRQIGVNGVEVQINTMESSDHTTGGAILATPMPSNYQAPAYGAYGSDKPTYQYPQMDTDDTASHASAQPVHPQGEGDHDHSPRSSDWNTGIRTAMFCLVMAFAWIAQLLGQLSICKSIGEAQAWLWSIMWAILGNFIVVALGGGLSIMLYKATFPNARSPDHAFVMFAVWSWIFAISTGIPFAMTASQAQSARIYLTNQREISCWRNGDNPTPLTSDNTNYITLVESKWVVDSRPWKQKMFTVVGTEEDEDASNRYNYCIAPVSYVGLVKSCPYNFYAVCYSQTTNHNAASCSTTDATTCGWGFPSATVVMRALNQRAEFYSDMEKADEDQWRNALSYASGSRQSWQQAPLLVEYASDGPDVMQTNLDTATASLNTQKLSFVIVYGFSVLIMAWLAVHDSDMLKRTAKGFGKVLLWTAIIVGLLLWAALEIY